MQAILFVELLGGIGDVLIALPAIQALSRSYLDTKLTVLTFPPGGELLETDPLVHQVVTARNGEARQAVEQLLAENSFDLIVSDTNYDGIDQIICSSAPRIVTNLWRSPPLNQFVSERFTELLLADGLITPDSIKTPRLHLTPAELQQAKAAIASLFPNGVIASQFPNGVIDNVSRPLVFLIADAGMAIKRWSEDNFIQLGQALQQYYQATILIPVGADPQQANRIAAGIGKAAQIWPRSSLRTLAAVLAQGDLVIAPDTGPARIAAALGVPTITLFGPSWHERYGQPSPHVNLQGYDECPERVIKNFTQQRCWYGGICPFEQWNTCLEAISVDRVMTTAAALLDAEALPTSIAHLPA